MIFKVTKIQQSLSLQTNAALDNIRSLSSNLPIAGEKIHDLFLSGRINPYQYFKLMSYLKVYIYDMLKVKAKKGLSFIHSVISAVKQDLQNKL